MPLTSNVDLSAWQTHVTVCLNMKRIDPKKYMKEVCAKLTELQDKYKTKREYTINVWPDPSKKFDKASEPEQVAQYLFALEQEAGVRMLDCNH